MIEYIKNNMGMIAVVSSVFVFGMLVGLYCNSNDDGIYISANYPNGVEVFVIGKNEIGMTDIDLKPITEADSKVIASKVKNLDIDHPLSMELREMAKRSNGPFRPIPVNINLHFVNEKKISGPVAKACKDTPIYGNVMIFYKVKDDVNANNRKNGIVSLQAIWQEVADCSLSADKNSYDLWVNKEYIEKWIGPIDTNNKITVEAGIIISDLSFSDLSI